MLIRTRPYLVLSLIAGLHALACQAQLVAPFESELAFTPANGIDERVLGTLRKKGIEPAARCSDEVFLRRVYFDLIGTLPMAVEARDFLQDKSPNKRAELVERLMQRPEFADYWAMKWGDLLRVKAEFPINLWPNAVQAYHRWIWEAMRDNKPYDQFARELLTSSGSNFRVPPVNFYRAVQGRDPANIAAAVALTFMGTRLDTWPEAKRTDLTAFFSRLTYKSTKEWKEEIVCLNPTATTPLAAVLPDGTKVKIAAGEDPREVFANWLLAPNNQWFARNIANRMWSWFMGRGIIHEPDDIRFDSVPVNPELLSYLQKELVGTKYDLRHLMRLIVNSRTYQQSPIARSKSPQVETLFAVYPVRRLEAEVLADALEVICGQGESYSSPIPEPFTYIPDEEPSIALADGSITSGFLEMFGRSPRDTGLESERNNQPTDAQRLYLLNSADIQRQMERSKFLARIMQVTKGNRPDVIMWVYMGILSRPPTEAEAALAAKHLAGAANTKQGAEDLAWALMNSKEFLYRH